MIVLLGGVINLPIEIIMLPMMTRRYLSSLKCCMSNQGCVERRHSSRLETMQQASEHKARHMKPAMRTPHPKPTMRKRRCSMIGYTTPPASRVSVVQQPLLTAQLTDAGASESNACCCRAIFFEVR